jgi:hypothetical protein
LCISCGVAFGSIVSEIGEGLSIYDRISNKYFYAAIGLLMVTVPALGKIRQGGQMRPVMAKAVAATLWTGNFICILLLAIHFLPETTTIIEAIFDFIERTF